MSADPRSPGIPPHFIVIVPGYMGSKLRDQASGEVVWMDIPRLLSNPFKIGQAVDEMLDKMRYPNPDIVPAGILDQLLIATPWAKQEHYGRLIDQLRAWNYKIDPKRLRKGDRAAYTFSYDWRQDNRQSGRELGAAIRAWEKRQPGAKAWIIAHSNGGIISRWFIQQEGGREYVDKLLLMGSPWDGAPKSIRVLMEGMEVLGLKKFNLFGLGGRMKELIRSFPSFYQLIPRSNPFLRDESNETVDLYADDSWLESERHGERDRAFLKDARDFNDALAAPTGVETICFYGTQSVTTTAGLVGRTPDGRLGEIQWLETGAGDGTVPTRSAVHPWVDEKHQVKSPATHGNIYIENGVLNYLRFDFAGRYQGESRAALSAYDFNVVFEPLQDFYAPGELIGAWAQVTNADGAVGEAQVRARLEFREPLPGDTVAAPPPPTEWQTLPPYPSAPGRYQGSLPGVAQPGYYRLLARVKVPKRPAVELEELVVVEE